MSLSEVRDVIDEHLVLGQAKEIQEVKNTYEAYSKISETNPYSIKELKKLALELHLIVMTIPDKPKSKNQRYVKK